MNNLPKAWQSKGMAATGVHVRPVVDLSHAQCDALAELASNMLEHHRMLIQQTVSKTGGVHLYVRVAEKEYHIARNGNAIKMGVVGEE